MARAAMTATLDALDWRLLAELQRDAAQTNAELAAQAFTSPATALRRVRALRERGIIERSVALLSPEALGASLSAIIDVTLDVQNAEAFDAFERLVAPEAAITQVYQTGPAVDFTVFVVVSTMADYQSLVRRLFTAAHNVRNIRTRFVSRRCKFEPALPLPLVS
ncbi:MAG: Lrp/AsnC family transcriptional regulator [Burkholderiales bacterium]|nr:Lrp/AsnC family transcriptional regulator [Burkholderiales bacterium]